MTLHLSRGDAAPAWRMYDCPHCRKPNFILLPSPIVGIEPGPTPRT